MATKHYGSTDQAKAAQGTAASPDAGTVDKFHQNADTDLRLEALHHTLGPSGTQASPGDHNHDGGTSSLLLTGITITGSRGGIPALVSVIGALVKLGATDSSTP